jgi:PEP-CTERM motif
VRRELFIGLVALALGLIAPLQAGVVNVPGSAIVWAAGNSTSAPDPQATAPPSISFALNTVTSISFSGSNGSVQYAGGATPNGAEGQGGGTNLNGYGGISGIQFAGHQFFLVGVFLGPGAATGPAPATLAYTDTLANSSVFNPLLAQAFFIGDGQGSAGLQSFNVPTGATRLFWGFGDGVGGTPGTYGDNSGSLNIYYDLNQSLVDAPEPSSIVLMGLGIAALTLLRRRRA